MTRRGTSGEQSVTKEKSKVFEHYFINFQLKGSDQLQTTEFSFPIWRAFELVEAGEDNFGWRKDGQKVPSRARHWLGDEDVTLDHVHPNYGGGEDELSRVRDEAEVL